MPPVKLSVRNATENVWGASYTNVLSKTYPLGSTNSAENAKSRFDPRVTSSRMIDVRLAVKRSCDLESTQTNCIPLPSDDRSILRSRVSTIASPSGSPLTVDFTGLYVPNRLGEY